MTLQASDTARNAMGDALTGVIGGSALLRIYDGTPPANVAASITGTLLAELTCNATFAPGASGGVLTLNAITADSSANASGTATHFRILTSGAVAHLQGTVTATGGGGDLTLNTTAIVAGGTVSVTTRTITIPGA